MTAKELGNSLKLTLLKFNSQLEVITKGITQQNSGKFSEISILTISLAYIAAWLKTQSSLAPSDEEFIKLVISRFESFLTAVHTDAKAAIESFDLPTLPANLEQIVESAPRVRLKLPTLPAYSKIDVGDLINDDNINNLGDPSAERVKVVFPKNPNAPQRDAFIQRYKHGNTLIIQDKGGSREWFLSPDYGRAKAIVTESRYIIDILRSTAEINAHDVYYAISWGNHRYSSQPNNLSNLTEGTADGEWIQTASGWFLQGPFQKLISIRGYSPAIGVVSQESPLRTAIREKALGLPPMQFDRLDKRIEQLLTQDKTNPALKFMLQEKGFYGQQLSYLQGVLEISMIISPQNADYYLSPFNNDQDNQEWHDLLSQIISQTKR